jgi:hypothetical protein
VCQLLQQLRTRPLFPLHLPPCCSTLYSTNRMFQNDFCSSHSRGTGTSVIRLFKLFSFSWFLFLLSSFLCCLSSFLKSFSPYFLLYLRSRSFFLSLTPLSLFPCFLILDRPGMSGFYTHFMSDRAGKKPHIDFLSQNTSIYCIYLHMSDPYPGFVRESLPRPDELNGQRSFFKKIILC